jgi:carbon storage regulator
VLVLVLSRRTGQTLLIGPDIIVRVLEIRGDQVRIGIDAPRNIPVHRQEVFERIQRERPGTSER